MGQNPFCTNIVMLHIKSKIMKRIQLCKHFVPGACLGVTRDKKVGFWCFFMIVTQLLLGYFLLES